MLELLHNDVTLIVDRYSYSGVAYSAAKQGMDFTWCKGPERGLPKPDVVIYLTLPVEVASQRQLYGSERYETVSIQSRASAMFERISDDSWKVVNADKSVDDLHKELKSIVDQVIIESEQKEIGRLWMDESLTK